MTDEAIQLWVRNDKGQVFGPLSPTSIELLLDNGIVQGRVQVSTDGSNYVFPGRAPGLRMIFPRELWGDVVVPGDELDAQWANPVLPPPLPTVGSETAPAHAASGSAVPGGPVAGPGARAAATAGPGARGGPIAGPGARAAQGARPFSAAQANAQARPQRPPGTPSAVPASSPSGPLSSEELFASSSPSAPALRPPPAPPARPAGPAFAIVMPGAEGSPEQPAHASPAHAPPVQAASGHAAPGHAAPGHAAPVHAVAPVSRPSSVAPSPVAASPARPAAPPVVHAAPVSSGDMPSSGSLTERPPPELYYLAAGANLTGRLTLQASDRVFDLWFRKGSPQYVDSTHPDDALEGYLLREQLCQPAQLAQAHKEKARFGGDILAALFALGLMNPNAALPRLAQRALTLLGHALLLEKGTFSWRPEELPAAKAMPLGNRWAAYLEQLRKTPFADVHRRMSAAMNLPIMKSGGLVPVENLRLNPHEARALTFFDGVRSLAQLVADLPSEADAMLITAWMLKPLELVSFAAVDASAPPPRREPPPPTSSPSSAGVAPPRPASSPSVSAVPGPPPAAVRAPGNPVMPKAPKMTVPYPSQKPSAPKPPGAPGAPVPAPAPAPVAAPAPRPPVVTAAAPVAPAPVPANVEGEVKQLVALFEQMKKKTFFDVLGVKKDADANAVKVAYFKLAKSYHPDTAPPGTPEALAKAKADIFALVGEANRVLSDPKLKADYLAEVEAGGTGEKVDVSKLFQAEEFFQKGCILVKARKYPEAVKMLDDAIKANGDEGEFYVWRGYAKFFGHTDKKFGQSEAMKDISYGLKKNPNVAAAHFFIGMMAKLNGDLAAAKKAFQRCVKMDPQHIDAQRELRMMK